MVSQSSSSERERERERESGQMKQGLGWMEWLRGWFYLAYEMLFQRIMASHLQNPMPLSPLNDITCIITGSTSGIGREIARQLAEAGAHVVMAVRNTKAAHELIRKWQDEWCGQGLPLNIEVMELDLLSLESVLRFAETWNARSGPLHVLINNAGIFSIGGPLSSTPRETSTSEDETSPTMRVEDLEEEISTSVEAEEYFEDIHDVYDQLSSESKHMHASSSNGPHARVHNALSSTGHKLLFISIFRDVPIQWALFTQPQKFSKDGYEEHMQVNHLAPALLSVLLLPSLIRGSPSRIINVNSIWAYWLRISHLDLTRKNDEEEDHQNLQVAAEISRCQMMTVKLVRRISTGSDGYNPLMHHVGFVDTEDMNVVSGKRKYTSLVGYSNSKLAQLNRIGDKLI
ncbi:unnamed protein product [Ilex paraguariensis]|uniref:Uncharacterized protein n=1 Tax=Ilex paraguariensis TaxID=185542 RepID=A0ABC8UNJ6_9AQUA